MQYLFWRNGEGCNFKFTFCKCWLELLIFLTQTVFLFHFKVLEWLNAKCVHVHGTRCATWEQSWVWMLNQVCVCVMCGKSGLWCLSLLNKGCQNLNKPSSDLSEASKAFKSFLLKCEFHGLSFLFHLSY